MRTKVIAGNWKMHKTNQEALKLVKAIKLKSLDIRKTKIIVCPPSTALSETALILKESNVHLGAQNMHWEEQGAFTGEISAKMIKSTGATFVIIGHSERRQFFGETNETVNLKLKTALANYLNPIICVGETLEQRESGITNDIVGNQVKNALESISMEDIIKVILAYEPVWAIGTGRTASPEQAQEVHSFIRNILSELYDRTVSEIVPIQYGGSVKPENAAELLQQQDIDGALVGGACLEADSFLAIIKAAEKLV